MPAATGEDRRAAIDRRLEETFGTFDAAIRNAHAAVARERVERAASGGTPGGAGEPGADGGEGADGSDGQARRQGSLESVDAGAAAGEGAATGDGSGAGTSEGEGRETVGAQGGGSGAGGTSGSGPREIPADIPDGRDDDIVARQIREAAMKETDPELRAALWEEYRRYKRGQ